VQTDGLQNGFELVQGEFIGLRNQVVTVQSQCDQLQFEDEPLQRTLARPQRAMQFEHFAVLGIKVHSRLHGVPSVKFEGDWTECNT